MIGCVIMKYKIIILTIILFIVFTPVVSAKEMCTVVSGNGKDIGSEIKCGSESFYVLENKNNKITMLTKYNLYVGDKIDYIAINENNPTYDGEDPNAFDEATDYCNSLATSKGYNQYYVYPMPEQTDNGVKVIGCRVYENIVTNHIRQDEKAVGTKLNGEGKSILPLYGITYMNPEWGYHENNTTYENEYDDNGNIIIDNSNFKKYFDGYKSELQSQGFEIDSVSFVTLDRILYILETISDKTIEVNLEYPDDPSYQNPDAYIGKMDIKDYISEKYKWLYSTTYWLGSGFKFGNGSAEYNDYYISNEGMLCALGRGECSYLPFPIGNGVRPAVSISGDDLLYMIRTKTDGNGTIEVVEKARGGDTINFKVSAKKGLKLGGLTITTDSGEKVTFNEEDISQDKKGVYSISTNKFVMPFENVTIEAHWVLAEENPKTGMNNYLLYLLIIIMFAGLIYKFAINKKNYLTK